MDILTKKFKEKFDKLKEEKGLTDGVIANDLNISQSLITHYNTGYRKPTDKFIKGVIKMYGLSYDYFEAVLSKSEYEKLIDENKDIYKPKKISSNKKRYDYDVINLRTKHIDHETLTKIASIAKIKNVKAMELVNEILSDYVEGYEKSLK